MLDDQNVITQRDTMGALDFAEVTPAQLVHNYALGELTPKKPIENIVFAGMGGSALNAEMLLTWPALSIPFVIVKNYSLPAFVNESTLVIVASYSGNTEETLEALTRARETGATIAALASGGKLEQESTAAGDVFVKLPDAPQPRMAVFYAYRALLELLIAFKLLEPAVLEELSSAKQLLDESVQQWKKDVPIADNPAKQMALQLVGKTPIMYAGPLMAPAAYKWKISFNESAKNTAWMGVYSEFNHNEFIGWSSHPVEKPFAVVDLTSSFEHERIQRRFEITDRMLSGMRPKAIRMEARGGSVISQLLYLVLFGDFVSLYLGILNGVDPSPVDLIERFKKELS